MRLAFISPFGLTPKATLSHRILPIASAFRKKGHEVIIAVPPYTNPEASGRIEVSGGVKLVNISLPGHLFYSLRIGLRLANIVKKFEPDILFIFKPKGYGALAGMLLWFTGKRYQIYLDIDDLESDRALERRMGYKWWERGFFRYQEKWLINRVKAITAASQYLKEYYGKKFGKVYYLPNGPAGIGAKVCILKNGNNMDNIRKKMGLQGKRIVLLYTRFTECGFKDIADFVRLISNYPEVIVLVVGEGYGRERQILMDELKKLNLSGFVIFTGWVSREELGRYLSLADVAIYLMADTPFNRAKCSAKLIELMAMGKPVVASPVGEILTYIKDGETGFIARDTVEMAEKSIELLKDRENAKKIGECARRFLYDNFNWDKLLTAIDLNNVNGLGNRC